MKKTYAMRQRILISLSLALIIILGTAGGIGYAVALHEADEIFSARLATSARVLESLLAKQIEQATINNPIVIELPNSLAQSPSDQATADGHPYETKIAFQIWSADQKLLVRSGFAPTERLGNQQAGFSERHVAAKHWYVFSLQSNTLWIEVGEEAGLRSELANDVATLLSSPLFVGAGLLLLAANFIVLHGFAPLALLAQHIAQRQVTDNTPVVLEHKPRELEPLLHALNALIQSTNQTLQRERRFTDMAAHELRTPLAALTLHAHNAANAANPDDAALSMAQLLRGLRRTKHLVDQMLTYSRISANNDEQHTSCVNLNQALQEQQEQIQALFENNERHIVLKLPDQTVNISARKTLLDIMLRNLLDNACKYNSMPEKAILVELTTNGQLHIGNPALPIAPEHFAHLCEPYFRPAQNIQGNGLGLAIAKGVADLHQWPMRLNQTPQGYFEVQVKF